VHKAKKKVQGMDGGVTHWETNPKSAHGSTAQLAQWKKKNKKRKQDGTIGMANYDLTFDLNFLLQPGTLHPN